MMPTLTLDQSNLRDFQKTIMLTAEQGKKSLSGAMIQAAIFASQSAAGSVYGQTGSGRFRKFGKKNRVSRRMKRLKPPRDKKTGRILPQTDGKRPWWAIGRVEIWSKGKKKDVFFRKESSFQRARKIPRRGLAGNVWRAAGAVQAGRIQGAFQRAFNADGTRVLSDRYSATKVSQTNGSITRIQMSNSLSYIQKIAPNSGRDGVAFANRKLKGILKRDLARQIERAFQKRQLT